MKKAVMFGEILLRFTTNNGERLSTCQNLSVCYGGSEANAAVSLCNYKMPAKFVTKLPQNPLGYAAKAQLDAHLVDTSEIIFGGERIGTYYVDRFSSLRSQKVFYDRKHSAIATAKAEEFNWDRILSDASWLHISGITPALSEECAKSCIDAVNCAAEKGLPISVDLNFRPLLWTGEAARKVMKKICEKADYCIAFQDEPHDIFGFSDNVKTAAEQMMSEFNFKAIAITQSRDFKGIPFDFKALVYDGNEYYETREYEIYPTEKVGGGDAFSGGFIYKLLSGADFKSAADFAIAAACLKFSVKGDFNEVGIEEVKELIERK